MNYMYVLSSRLFPLFLLIGVTFGSLSAAAEERNSLANDVHARAMRCTMKFNLPYVPVEFWPFHATSFRRFARVAAAVRLGLIQHSPDDIQVRGNCSTVPPPRERRSPDAGRLA